LNAPTHAPNATLTDGERSIGAILVDNGKLKLHDAERILQLQRQKGLRFGEAAIELGLLREEDIKRALAQQFEYPYLTRGQSQVSEEVIAAYQPFSPVVEELRALRSQLMLRWFDTEVERKALAIVSPEHGDGRSWMAANLAVVFSQLGERTLLIDADMRRPRLHAMFGIDNKAGLSSILAGRTGTAESIQRIASLLDLSVLPAGAMPPNPQELLNRPAFSQLLAQVSENFDVVIVDTPPTFAYSDAQTTAVRASGALVLARKNVSRSSRLQGCAQMLVEASATVVGTVMNDF
jgi:protein-tyrosine kinase